MKKSHQEIWEDKYEGIQDCNKPLSPDEEKELIKELKEQTHTYPIENKIMLLKGGFEGVLKWEYYDKNFIEAWIPSGKNRYESILINIKMIRWITGTTPHKN